MGAPGGLHLDYLSLADSPSARWDEVLGVATFDGAARARAAPQEVPVANVATPVLAGGADVSEVWSGAGPATSGQYQQVRFRRTQELLFGCVAVSECELPRAPEATADHAAASSALHQATTLAYRQLCATLDAESYPHLLRVWNYVPDINRDSHGVERYRQFNTARQHALRGCGRALRGSVPAASALGCGSDGPLVVYFLAGRTAPVFVENPRQVSAYHYPPQYGSHRPAFSRATLLRQAQGVALFISGTASIVGHRSLHVGDTAAQTRETLTNIEALIGEANRVASGAHFRLDALTAKVYVRRPADLPLIRAELGGALGDKAKILYLQADICRQDLLVEIEATALCPLPAAA
jgi:chorismate lyase/3-hydroxybenzoate synthase